MLRRGVIAGLGALVVAAPAARATGQADVTGPKLVIQVAGQAQGTVAIQLLPDVAPKSVQRLMALAKSGVYDGVVFHRVIDGFMAQTGDVKFGHHGGDLSRAGLGGSDMPNVPAEFSKIPFERGTVGMARSQEPDSANSQFFIDLAPAPFLNGKYTVVGRVVEGMDVVDAIRKGAPGSGAVADPDWMAKVTVE